MLYCVPMLVGCCWGAWDPMQAAQHATPSQANSTRAQVDKPDRRSAGSGTGRRKQKQEQNQEQSRPRNCGKRTERTMVSAAVSARSSWQSFLSTWIPTAAAWRHHRPAPR